VSKNLLDIETINGTINILVNLFNFVIFTKS